jgi:hypothetical protein
MARGSSRAVTADAELEVETSDAGAVAVTVNGRRYDPLGRDGERKVMTFKAAR